MADWFPTFCWSTAPDARYAPPLPVDECGKIRQEVQRALGGLRFTQLSSYPVDQPN